jgi:mono/diheme cytochrome c family protein
MIHYKPIAKKLAILLIVSVFATANISAQDGKALFNAKCASCHNIFKNTTGPALMGFEERGPWADRAKLYEWVKNPAAFMAKDAYTKGLFDQYKSMMSGFADLSNENIDLIAEYIKAEASKPKDAGTAAVQAADDSDRNAIIFGIISLIMAIIAVVLMQVNSNLKKMSDDHESILRPDPVPFYRNKAFIALGVIMLFIIGGFYVVKGAIGLGRQKNYQPEQPIYYSHKVHAGINQISCLYCHGNAMEGKSAAIPSVNVCMNCHKAINTYEKGPKLFNEDGEEINGTAEINKLYKYAGFDPENPNDWDPSKAKPIEWTRIHNLPDHVYFNHSQHVKAGDVQCQTCHGEITAMDEVKQFSELSMSWCINCHRETKVNFAGNKFYSIYEKFHNDVKSGRMDSVTVKDIGGLECQKCHY